jgi:hypothetical protein
MGATVGIVSGILFGNIVGGVIKDRICGSLAMGIDRRYGMFVGWFISRYLSCLQSRKA